MLLSVLTARRPSVWDRSQALDSAWHVQSHVARRKGDKSLAFDQSSHRACRDSDTSQQKNEDRKSRI